MCTPSAASASSLVRLKLCRRARLEQRRGGSGHRPQAAVLVAPARQRRLLPAGQQLWLKQQSLLTDSHLMSMHHTRLVQMLKTAGTCVTKIGPARWTTRWLSATKIHRAGTSTITEGMARLGGCAKVWTLYGTIPPAFRELEDPPDGSVYRHQCHLGLGSMLPQLC